MTKLRGPAWLRIAAVSTISTINVERPRARSSAAPTRLKRRSTTPIRAVRAGTAELYRTGSGVVEDPAALRAWCEKAAEQGNPEATAKAPGPAQQSLSTSGI